MLHRWPGQGPLTVSKHVCPSMLGHAGVGGRGGCMCRAGGRGGGGGRYGWMTPSLSVSCPHHTHTHMLTHAPLSPKA